jgi:hypothetical protein
MYKRQDNHTEFNTVIKAVDTSVYISEVSYVLTIIHLRMIIKNLIKSIL